MAFKIYTKTGDAGETGLFGGRRVPKSHLRVDSYGTLDELNAFTGLLKEHTDAGAVREQLAAVQHKLFTIGAHLASDPEKSLPAPGLDTQDILDLETWIDGMEEHLPPLKNFILPGGGKAASYGHVCRTVCRRAERLVVALSQTTPVDPLVLQYLNRLSDYFFVLSRYLSHLAGEKDVLWNPK